MIENRATRVWASIHARARADGTGATVQHACLACAQATVAAGAGLSMTSGTGPELMFATDSHAEELEELQFTLGQGPAVDGADGASPVLVADLSAAEAWSRWPLFAPAAAERGIGAVFAFPVAAGAARFGMLDLYRRSAGPLSSAELADALAYSDAILVLALYDRGGLHAGVEMLTNGDLAERRAEVHQAAGMASIQLGVTVIDALARLRAYAFVHDRGLAEVAADVVARRLRFSSDAPADNHADESGSDRPQDDGKASG
ncbi:MAG TPA: ANTAR domain-containing protein [Jiangellaceae bacterium]